MKDIYRSKCRNCHSYCEHLGGSFRRKFEMGLYNLVRWPSKPEKLDCLRYIPSDNLEYLEWSYSARNNCR